MSCDKVTELDRIVSELDTESARRSDKKAARRAYYAQLKETKDAERQAMVDRMEQKAEEERKHLEELKKLAEEEEKKWMEALEQYDEERWYYMGNEDESIGRAWGDDETDDILLVTKNEIRLYNRFKAFVKSSCENVDDWW